MYLSIPSFSLSSQVTPHLSHSNISGFTSLAFVTYAAWTGMCDGEYAQQIPTWHFKHGNDVGKKQWALTVLLRGVALK